MMNMSSAGVAYGEEVSSANWTHVKNCSFEGCIAAFNLRDVSSLTK